MLAGPGGGNAVLGVAGTGRAHVDDRHPRIGQDRLVVVANLARDAQFGGELPRAVDVNVAHGNDLDAWVLSQLRVGVGHPAGAVDGDAQFLILHGSPPLSWARRGSRRGRAFGDAVPRRNSSARTVNAWASVMAVAASRRQWNETSSSPPARCTFTLCRLAAAMWLCGRTLRSPRGPATRRPARRGRWRWSRPPAPGGRRSASAPGISGPHVVLELRRLAVGLFQAQRFLHFEVQFQPPPAVLFVEADGVGPQAVPGRQHADLGRQVQCSRSSGSACTTTSASGTTERTASAARVGDLVAPSRS